MKKVAVLMLLMTLNLGAVAQELIFSNDFECGWPCAWAQAVGWSAFVVKDSTGALVGPVVGWWTGGDERSGSPRIPLVASWIDGEKVIFKVSRDRLLLGRELVFSGSDCTGQAYLCTLRNNCGAVPGEDEAHWHAGLREVAFALDEDNVLYRAAPPVILDSPFNSVIEEFDQTTYDDPSPTCENRNPGNLQEGWAAQPVVDLDTLFTPPFTLE